MIWIWVAAAIAVDGAAGLAGAIVPERWLTRYRAPILGFAVGALLATSFGDVLPAAVAQQGPGALVVAALAIAAVAIVERLIIRDRRTSERPVVSATLLISDAFHNIGDGIAIAAAFIVSVHLGVVTSCAVLVHELPEEISAYAVVRAAGTRRARALALLAGVQLTAGLGAAGTLLASSLVARGEGVMLAIAGGTFAYIAVVELAPELLRKRQRSALFAAIIAAVFLVAIR